MTCDVSGVEHHMSWLFNTSPG